ncbi:hypothetical protein DICPUDRAFT_157950 [Dictyostelium purpureum]|uniref:Methyltransferase type 11 domain-containing protein n=1 Tax=Dictyostelium purpureum TaxID=5786 RepID=F1A0F6_DICPU|nr:uncharacterized protein DICPUDRAFT_157950 [Dictyostelium purpureum]EGC30324.1 hypothetical protein DICPUDRAFT_157950 [Dictyostelium purpureum]|eukprot:XP_003293147.1 hypothetical protein DICPUDRAFT_157950 [Dictyostelium purpureum]
MSSQDNNKITNTAKFQDEFGKFSKNYSSFRPLYPDSLYQLIDETVEKDKRSLAVDVGCGSGQNSIRLAALFKKVIAFDPSEGQITNALKHDNVEYHVGSAEKINVPDDSADLVTVATALHWFNLPIFFKETERILKSGGFFIGFTYGFHEISNNEKANLVNRELHETTIGPEYWNQAVRKLVDGGYKDIVPPFKETKRTSLKFHTRVSIESLIGHYSSWSAYSQYVKTNPDPLPQIKEKILEAYGTTDDQSPIVECEYTISIIISKKD